MLTPSYDFNLFNLDQFSPLLANELGAGTSFSAADPTSYVDYSLNQLSGLLQPYNPLPYLSNQVPIAFAPSPGGSGLINPTLITPQAPQSFFQTPSRSVLLGGGSTTVNVNPPTGGQGQVVINPSGVPTTIYGPNTTMCKLCQQGQAAAAAIGLSPQDCTFACGTGGATAGAAATASAAQSAACKACQDAKAANPKASIDCGSYCSGAGAGDQGSNPLDPFGIQKFFDNLPTGAPMLILAVVVIILLLLFVGGKKK
jgi:hypothetical protein